MGTAPPTPHAITAAVRSEVAAGWRQLADSRGYCSSVAQLDCEGIELVIKAPANERFGFFWRYLLRREHRAYAHLEGVAGVPRCYGLVDGRFLVLERVSGTPFREAVLDGDDAFFSELLALIERLHARGVVHGDLKKKENLLVGESGAPIALDFATAMVRRSGFAPLNHFMWRALRQFDFNAWLKHKYRRDLSKISVEDSRYYRQTPIERLNTLVVHRLLPRSRPRHRETAAGRSRGEGEGEGGLLRRFASARRESRAWRAALGSEPVAFGTPFDLVTLDGARVGVAPDGRVWAGQEVSATRTFSFEAVRPEPDLPRYGALTAVRTHGGQLVQWSGEAGDLTATFDEGAAGERGVFRVFDPTSRFQEGEPVRPGLPISLATPDQQRRWLHDSGEGGPVVASKRYLRRSSTFVMRLQVPRAPDS
ncbi:MAG: hypothetical protein VYE73_12985 [Acidobacteriota bacterium]|nr:hypothetical protein [Acidobacteriota bacterium]